MSGLLINGCYDSKTLETLIAKQVSEFSFDLRPRSFNLIKFSELTTLLKNVSTGRTFLTFANDSKGTILSYLNLLQNTSINLIFRDAREPEFYDSLNHSFYWMFDPSADWKSILLSKNIIGVFLPLKHQNFFHKVPEMWEIIERKHLDIYLHADNFEESLLMNLNIDVKISIDLTSEVESSYRNVNHNKLMNMKIWRQLNETTSRQ